MACGVTALSCNLHFSIGDIYIFNIGDIHMIYIFYWKAGPFLLPHPKDRWTLKSLAILRTLPHPCVIQVLSPFQEGGSKILRADKKTQLLRANFCMLPRLGTNISHLGKRKYLHRVKSALKRGYVIVPRRVALGGKILGGGKLFSFCNKQRILNCEWWHPFLKYPVVFRLLVHAVASPFWIEDGS